MTRSTPERTTVQLPSDLLGRARRKAAVEHRTLTSLIEEGLRQVVAGNPKSAATRRVLPRISKASGGLLPGVDLADLSRLQEIDDQDHVGRMQRGG